MAEASNTDYYPSRYPPPPPSSGTSDAIGWQVQQLQTQLGNSMNMCQALIRDQQAMSGLLQTSMSGK